MGGANKSPRRTRSASLFMAQLLAESRVDVRLPDLDATGRLAAALAARARPGDVIGLRGDLGAGKTTFARAFIHARAASAGAAQEEVPSPTFTLVQTYDFPGGPVWHFDLYRLSDPEEVFELGWEEALAEAVALVEWPERLGPLVPDDYLEIALVIAVGESRRATLRGTGGWAGRLDGLDV